MTQDVTPDLAAALHLSVERGSVITAVDGRAIDNAAALRNQIGLTRAGETVTVTLVRDGRERTLDVTIGEAPSAATRPLESQAGSKLDGATFRELDPSHPLYGQVRGVVVSRVAPGSTAARAGLAQIARGTGRLFLVIR